MRQPHRGYAPGSGCSGICKAGQQAGCGLAGAATGTVNSADACYILHSEHSSGCCCLSDASSYLQAMNDARRLVRHHPEHVSQHVHALLWDIVPVIDDLRSFVSKTALTLTLVNARCKHDLVLVFPSKCHNPRHDETNVYVCRSASRAWATSWMASWMRWCRCCSERRGQPPAAGTVSSRTLRIRALLEAWSALCLDCDLICYGAAELSTTLITCRVLSAMLSCTSPLRFVGALVLAATNQKGPKVRCKIAAHLDSSLQSEHGHCIAGKQCLPLLFVVSRIHFVTCNQMCDGQRSPCTMALSAVCSTCDTAGARAEGG